MYSIMVQLLSMNAAVLTAVLAWAATMSVEGKKLDVIMIAVDDLRPELSCYGCEYMKTPVLEGLASQSLVFDHMYTGIALCAPSRTLFLTTRRADTSRVWTISPQEYWRVSGGNFTSLPQHFKDNGYLTLGTGKIFHPGAPSNNSDSEYSWSPACLPYQNTFPEPDGATLYTSPAVHPYNVTDDDTMGEGKLALNAVRLLKEIATERHNGSTRPFFFAAGFHRPHIPWHAPAKYYDMYDPDMPLAPNLHPPQKVPSIALNNNWVGKNFTYEVDGVSIHKNQGYWTQKFEDLDAIRISTRMPEDDTTVPVLEMQKVRQAYRAAISFTDRNIGVVLSAAKDLGLFDNSIVVFWADHGYQLGDNGEWGKHTDFEHATRIPFMVKLPTSSFPSFKPGRTAAFVENVDLYPTLSDIAMGMPMEQCSPDANTSRKTLVCTEGLSFKPVLTDPSRSWKLASFSQYNRLGETIMGYSIRKNGWRFTQWVHFDKKKAGYPGGAEWDHTVGIELYNHSIETKPCDWDYESVNLAGDPQYATIQAQLKKELQAGWRAAMPSN